MEKTDIQTRIVINESQWKKFRKTWKVSNDYMKERYILDRKVKKKKI